MILYEKDNPTKRVLEINLLGAEENTEEGLSGHLKEYIVHWEGKWGRTGGWDAVISVVWQIESGIPRLFVSHFLLAFSLLRVFVHIHRRSVPFWPLYLGIQHFTRCSSLPMSQTTMAIVLNELSQPHILLGLYLHIVTLSQYNYCGTLERS